MKRLILTLLLIVYIFTLSACAPSPVEADGIQFTDASGQTVILPKEPKNAAVLFSSFADIWVSAGGKVEITVGESIERGFAESDAILVDGGAGKTIDIEALIASNPDIVIASADIDAQKEAAEICRKAGIPTVLLQVESFDDYLDALKLFTDITGKTELFEKYGTAVKEEIDDIKESFTYDSKTEKILFIRAGSSERSTKAKNTEQHFVCGMLKELGAENIADYAPVLLDGLSFEDILMHDPEFIFISTMGDENAAKEYMSGVLEKTEWQSLSAVKNGKVYFLPKDLFQFKPNALWAESYKYLAEILND